jgi:hypothetical protein
MANCRPWLAKNSISKETGKTRVNLRKTRNFQKLPGKFYEFSKETSDFFGGLTGVAVYNERERKTGNP